MVGGEKKGREVQGIKEYEVMGKDGDECLSSCLSVCLSVCFIACLSVSLSLCPSF